MTTNYTAINPDQTLNWKVPSIGEFFNTNGGIFLRTDQGVKPIGNLSLLSETGITNPQTLQKIDALKQLGNQLDLSKLASYNMEGVVNSIGGADIWNRQVTDQSTPFSELSSYIAGHKSGQFLGQDVTKTFDLGGGSPTGKIPSVLGDIMGGTSKTPYPVPAGSNLTASAKAMGITLQQLLDANPQYKANPNMVQAGANLNYPGGAVTTSQAPRNATDLAKADQIKKIQDEITSKTLEMQKMQTEEAKLTSQTNIEKLKQQLELTKSTPGATPLTDQFTTLMQSGDVTTLQSGINDLKSQVRDLDASYLAEKNQQNDRLAPMENIGTRQQKLYDSYTQKRTQLTNQLQTAQDEYSTKIGIIDKMMTLKQQDYQNSVAEYNTKFTQTIQLDQLLNGESDNARANLSVLINLGNEVGYSSDLLSSMKKEALKAGIDFSHFEAFTSIQPKANILTTTSGYDANGNQQVTFIYKDPKTGLPGIVQTVYTGGINSTNSSPNDKVTVGQFLGLKGSQAVAFDNDLEQMINGVYAGKLGKTGAREEAYRQLSTKYPGITNLWEVIYGSDKFNAAFPNGYESKIKSSGINIDSNTINSAINAQDNNTPNRPK